MLDFFTFENLSFPLISITFRWIAVFNFCGEKGERRTLGIWLVCKYPNIVFDKCIDTWKTIPIAPTYYWHFPINTSKYSSENPFLPNFKLSYCQFKYRKRFNIWGRDLNCLKYLRTKCLDSDKMILSTLKYL